MKVTCLVDNLRDAIQASERLVGKKESLPVLSCLLIESQKNTLTIKATNLEAGIKVTFPADVSTEGKIAIPAQILSSILKVTHGEKVTLSGEENSLNVVARSGTTSIRAVASEEFPDIPFPEKSKRMTLSRQALIEGFQSVMYAASQSMIRPELASISVSYADGALVFAATDSFRLAEKRMYSKLSDMPEDILIPQKNAIELVNVLSSLDVPDVSLSSDDTQLYLESEGGLKIQFVSRIIDASFPNYKEILPKTFSTEATLLTRDFSEALKKARLFSNASQQVSFHLYPKKKVFSITARNQDVGEMDDALEAAVTGEDIDINFNISYIADCLQSVHADSISLQFAGTGKPLVLRPVGEQTFTYLVMPLNR